MARQPKYKDSIFSKNLKYLRKAKGISQEFLAIELDSYGVNVLRPTIGGYEEGRNEPNIHCYLSICAYFGQNPWDMFMSVLTPLTRHKGE